MVRALIDRETLARAMNLESNQHVLLAQTVGYPQLAASAAGLKGAPETP